jgi:hypothetical protein
MTPLSQTRDARAAAARQAWPYFGTPYGNLLRPTAPYRVLDASGALVSSELTLEEIERLSFGRTPRYSRGITCGCRHGHGRRAATPPAGPPRRRRA